MFMIVGGMTRVAIGPLIAIALYVLAYLEPSGDLAGALAVLVLPGAFMMFWMESPGQQVFFGILFVLHCSVLYGVAQVKRGKKPPARPREGAEE
jgi:hypothetical protein